MGEFRAFIAKGNVLDLAVAVIIGAAFAAIVTSLTGDLIMPLIGAIVGKLDFSNYYLLLGPVPPDYHGPASYAALKAAGVAEDRIILKKPETITGGADPREARRVEISPAA